MIVANDVAATEAGSGVETNRVVFLRPRNQAEELPLTTKAAVAEAVLAPAIDLSARSAVEDN